VEAIKKSLTGKQADFQIYCIFKPTAICGISKEDSTLVHWPIGGLIVYVRGVGQRRFLSVRTPENIEVIVTANLKGIEIALRT